MCQWFPPPTTGLLLTGGPAFWRRAFPGGLEALWPVGQSFVPFPITLPSLAAADPGSPVHLYFVVRGEFFKIKFY